MKSKNVLILSVVILTLGFTLAFVIIMLTNSSLFGITESVKPPYSQEDLSLPKITNLVENTSLTVETGKTTTHQLYEYNNINSELPKFVSAEQSQLTITPTKADIGHYTFISENSKNDKVVLNLEVTPPKVDSKKLTQEIKEYLGEDVENFGISIKNLHSDASININGSNTFPPASMAKMTMAILAMRDIESGKYNLDSTYPLNWKFRFSAYDDLADMADGTQVPISKYLEQLIVLSSNTAWYHLHEFLGRSYGEGGINDRTVNELGVHIFLDPHIGTPDAFAELFAGLYSNRYLNKENSDYLINLMKSAAQWNREGIAQSFSSEIEFANKIGNLWTDTEISFEDTAIVYGKNADYVISVMNKNTEWESGKVMLKEIGTIVHRHMDGE